MTTCQQAKEFNANVKDSDQKVETIVEQMDDSMVPMVTYKEASKEQKSKGLKKYRDCHWREVRPCSASLPNNGLKLYGVVLGSPLEAGLPIGSGEVESGHRSVLQARLKKPGAGHAENMAHLKVLQENNHWEEFWAQKAA